MGLVNITLETYMRVLQNMLKSSTIYRPICEYCNGCKKNQQLFAIPICEYCSGCKKNEQLFTIPICEYCNGWKNQ